MDEQRENLRDTREDGRKEDRKGDRNRKRKKADIRTLFAKTDRRQLLLLCAGGLLILICLITAIASVSRKKAKTDGKTESFNAVTAGSYRENVPQPVAENAEKADAEAALPEQESASSVPSAVSGAGTGTVTISAVGDCTFGRDEGFSYSTSFNAYYDEHGYQYFMKNVKDYLSSDDLTIANLETTFTESKERKDKTYAFKAPPEYAKILSDGSIEACNIANNHSNDYGSQSYTDTIENIEAQGITVFGYDLCEVIEVNGVKVGLIGYLELWDEYDTEPKMIAGIEELKKKGAELIIVTMHWGNEKDYYPDSIQQYLGHSAIDHGAHLVLGHHPHRIQGIEIYKGRAICYSLSNFSFGGNRNPADMDSFIFRQTFTVKDGEVEENEEYEVVPISISGHSDYNDYQPRILTGEKGERVFDKVEELSEPFREEES